MVSWAENLARDTEVSLCVIVRIEGVGPSVLSSVQLAQSSNDGRYRFVVKRPDYAASQAPNLWQELLTGLPTFLDEQVERTGGATEMGSLSASILDGDVFSGFLLTELLAVDAPPTYRLASSVNSTFGAFTLNTTADLVAGQAIYIGSECVRVQNAPTGTLVDVERGYMGTDAVPHDAGDRVFLRPPNIIGRRIEVALAPLDGDSSSDEQVFDSFIVSSLEFDDTFNVWRLQAQGQLRYLERRAPIEPRPSFKLRSARTFETGFSSTTVLFEDTSSLPAAQSVALWPDNKARFLTGGDEVIEAEIYTSNTGSAAPYVAYVLARSLVGTANAEIRDDEEWRNVFIAGEDFRYSPTQSTARDSGTWTKTAHWVDILLIIMTSSADPIDGLELLNWRGAYANYSSLPAGYGLGIPAALIDFDSFLEVRARTLDYELPNFAYGGESRSFHEWVGETILSAMGAYLSVINGLISLVKPRLPSSSESTATITTDDVLANPTAGDMSWAPNMRVRRRLGDARRGVSYKLGPQEYLLNVLAKQYQDAFGQQGYYATDGNTISISVPGASRDQGNLWEEQAIAKLWRQFRPPLQVSARLKFSAGWALQTGQVIQATIGGLPNSESGARGWSLRVGQVYNRRLILGAENNGTFFEVEFDVFPGRRVGLVAYSAAISGVSGAIATVAANRYTKTDAFGGLPTSDASPFQEGDILKLVTRAGVEPISGLTESVVSVSGNDITLSGNFNSQLAVGLVLVSADRDDAVVRQTGRYAHYADLDSGTIGSVTETPWSYGER